MITLRGLLIYYVRMLVLDPVVILVLIPYLLYILYNPAEGQSFLHSQINLCGYLLITT